MTNIRAARSGRLRQVDAAQARRVAALLKALDELPRIAKALTDKPRKGVYDCVHLELVAAELVGDICQGANHYCTVPPELGRALCSAAEQVLVTELAKLGVRPPGRKRA